jgi:hypothetical protein
MADSGTAVAAVAVAAAAATMEASAADSGTADASSGPFSPSGMRVNLLGLDPSPLPISGAVAFSRVSSCSPGQVGGALSSPPSDLLVFSTTPESVGVPLSPVASVASCGSAVAGRSGGAGRSSACFPSESRHPGASSTPPGLAAHKHALRDEGRAKAATGGVFPFVPRKELTIEVKPNLLNVLD